MPGILLLIPRWFQILKTIFILLWVAEGLVEPAPGCILEDEASNYFNSWSYFELAYPRHPGPGLKSFDLDPLYYKLRLDWRTMIILLWTMNSFNIMVLMVWSQRRCAMLLWFAVPYLKDASCIQGVYAQFSCERNSLTVTLNSQLNYVPGYLFLRARYLLVLDLSHAGFKMLPSYVWELIHLRHLDLSYNPIQTLSGLIINLFHLQTLKLICCFQLTSFPDNLHLLSNLCHLVISPSIPIVMPTFIDRLTCLQTLMNFTVLKKDGYQIEELKNLMTFMENLASKISKMWNLWKRLRM